MSRRFKKILSVVCAMCLFVNLLMVHASGDMHLEMGTIKTSNRVPILTLTPGNGVGQLGYSGSEARGYIGPDSFAVENGTVYILDGVNNRIVICQNGEYSSISLTGCYYASTMKYQAGRIAVSDNQSNVTVVYDTDGTQLAVIPHPNNIAEAAVVKITEIGDSYVVWKTFEGACYRYDWVAKTMRPDEEVITLQQSDVSESLWQVIGSISQQEWYVQSENRIIEILGERGDALVYEQYQYVPNVDMVFTELSIRKVDSDGNETFAIIDFSDWKAPASDPLYLSSDGKIYLMECLEDSVVISEVSLGTADISHMGQLEKQAEVRRAEVQVMENSADVSVCEINDETYTSSRRVAKERAEEMIKLEWTVLENHKAEATLYSDKITIPKCIMDATVGSTFKGIPYCWGGYNGLNNVGSYSSFASVVGLTDRTAGNIQSEYNEEQQGHVPYTIGIDCSGFVTSVYNMSGTKYGTSHLLQFGHSVTEAELKPMDFIVKNGHTMLFVAREGNLFKTYESFSGFDDYGNEIGGKTMEWQWTLADLQTRGYTYRSPFHSEACNTDGRICCNETYHETVCLTCEYVWPNTKQSHDQSGEYVVSYPIDLQHAPTCSACGFIGTYEDHDENGEMLCEMDEHYYTCSKCEWIGASEAHSFNSYGYCDICGYDG